MVVKSFYEHVLAQIQTLTVVFGSINVLILLLFKAVLLWKGVRRA